MLTRLKVSGFKNLVDVDVRFGPFTCVAGANGVGKSNLFDAIRLLSALADMPLIEAASFVRDDGGRIGDVRSLFHRIGDQYDAEMTFAAEMIIPREGVDDLGQKAEASITFLQYTLTLAYRIDDSFQSLGSLEIVREELRHINQSDAAKRLGFPHKPVWRKSAITGRRQEAPFISTEYNGNERFIKLHQDGSGGRPRSLLASSLPRTVLSVSNAAESPTALLARREMQSWRLLQLEPSALRKPDVYTAPTKLGADGSHLPATVYRLARAERGENGATAGRVYSEIANRLSTLIEDVHMVNIDLDDRRELLTLQVTAQDGTVHPARALSDGTLRFLALVVLELDPQVQGLLCLEEPENGIHPKRIPAILQLLQDIATDVDEAVSVENPLRQIIINTHSPVVVQQVPEDSLLVAELRDTLRAGKRFKRAVFSALPGTWRERAANDESASAHVVALGDLLAYLNPAPPTVEVAEPAIPAALPKTRRVIDRDDVRQLTLPLFAEN